MLISPIVHIEELSSEDASRALVTWGHRMEPCRRPMGTLSSHGMFAHGKLVAVTVTAELIASTCAGMDRYTAIELARLCAIRPDLLRPMLRLWREFVFPCFGRQWAVSCQDRAAHAGNTYRFDGWIVVKDRASSGSDSRSGRKGRVKQIWGWHADPAARAARAACQS